MPYIAGEDQWLPVLMLNSTTRVGVEDIAYLDATVHYQQSGQAVVELTLSAANWKPGMAGAYEVLFPSALQVAGGFFWWAESSGCDVYSGWIEIEAADTGGGDILWTHDVTIDGSPQSEILVEYYPTSARTGTPSARDTTDEQGRVTFMLAAGTYYSRITYNNVVIEEHTETVS